MLKTSGNKINEAVRMADEFYNEAEENSKRTDALLEDISAKLDEECKSVSD